MCMLSERPADNVAAAAAATEETTAEAPVAEPLLYLF